MDEPVESIRVDARRLGRSQRFALTVSDADGVVDERQHWGVVQWASKPRTGRGEFAPWWYEEGRTWHLYEGELPPPGEELPPPKASFASLDGVKAHVRVLVAGGPAAG